VLKPKFSFQMAIAAREGQTGRGHRERLAADFVQRVIHFRHVKIPQCSSMRPETRSPVRPTNVGSGTHLP